MASGSFLPQGHPIVDFIKNPVWALLIGVFLSLPLLKRANFSNRMNSLFKTACEKSAQVILITGCGGAFGQVIKDSGIVDTLLSDYTGVASTGVLVPFFLSFLFTSVTGSITVSLITTTSIVAPMVSKGTLDPSLTAAAIGAGSLGLIHVNSSFFWLFKETHNIATSKLLGSFTLLTGIVALSAGIMVFVLSYLVL